MYPPDMRVVKYVFYNIFGGFLKYADYLGLFNAYWQGVAKNFHIFLRNCT